MLENTIRKYGGHHIKGVKNPSEKAIIAALESNPYNIEFIDNPSEKVCKIALTSSSGRVLSKIAMKYHTKEIVELAVKTYGRAITYARLDLITIDLFKLAIKENYDVFDSYHTFFKRTPMSTELKEFAIDQQPLNLRFVAEPTEELCLRAVKYSYLAFEYVPSELKTLNVEILALKNLITTYDKAANINKQSLKYQFKKLFPLKKLDDSFTEYLRHLEKEKLKEKLLKIK